MAPEQVLHVDAARLGALREVGRGSHGRILAAPAVRINRRWPALYMEYDLHQRAAIDINALESIVGLLANAGEDEERWLCERAAWPAAVVDHGGLVTGFLTRQPPERFVTAADVIAGRAPGVDQPACLAALHDAGELLAKLHSWGVQVGPLQPYQLLIGRSGQPRCFLLGCDAFRLGATAATIDADRAALDGLGHQLISAAAAEPAALALPPGSPGMPPPPSGSPGMPPLPSGSAGMPPPVSEPAPAGRSLRWIAVAAAALVAVLAIAVTAYVVVRRPRGTNPAAPAAAAPSNSTVPPTGSPSSAGPAPASPEPRAAPSRVGLVDVAAVTADPRALDVAAMFDTYFSAINARDYDRAISVYDPGGSINPNDPVQRQHFVQGVSTTTEADVHLLSVGAGDGGQTLVPARVTFQSNQQAGYGPKGRESETCTRWDVTYALRLAAEHQYRIVRATAASNRPC